MVAKIIFKFKKNFLLDDGGIDERNKVLFEKIKSLVINSENSRLCALVELRKDMVREYKDKYEKCAQELYDLKLKINVSTELLLIIL